MLHQVCQCIYTAPHVLHRLGFRDEDEESVAAAVAAVRSGLQQSTESGKTAPMHDGGGGAHGGGGGGSNAAAGAAGGSTALDASSLPFTVSLSQSTSSKLSLLAPTTHATAAAVAPHHHAFAKLLVMSEHYTIPHNTTTHNTTTHNTMTQQPTHHEGSRNQSDTAGIGAIGIGATATGASVTGTPPLSMASETAGPQQVPSHAVVGVIQGLQEGVEEHVRALEGVYHSVWDVDKEAYLRYVYLCVCVLCICVRVYCLYIHTPTRHMYDKTTLSSLYITVDTSVPIKQPQQSMQTLLVTVRWVNKCCERNPLCNKGPSCWTSPHSNRCE